MTAEKENIPVNPHEGCAKIEAWLAANGFMVEVNGLFDRSTRDGMRAALLQRTGWDSIGARHQTVMQKMHALMDGRDD